MLKKSLCLKGKGFGITLTLAQWKYEPGYWPQAVSTIQFHLNFHLFGGE